MKHKETGLLDSATTQWFEVMNAVIMSPLLKTGAMHRQSFRLPLAHPIPQQEIRTLLGVAVPPKRAEGAILPQVRKQMAGRTERQTE